MNIRLFTMLWIAVAALAQPSVTLPGVGLARATDGSVHAVTGIAGNFIVDNAGISNALSASFSGVSGLVKTDANLLVLDASYQVAATYNTSPGPAIFAFDTSGAPSLTWLASTLFQFDAAGLDPVQWTGDAVAISLDTPRTARIVDRRDAGLWDVHVSLDSGAVTGESLLAGITAPVLLLPDRSILYATTIDLVVRDSSGAERRLAAGFQAAYFERIGKDWIAVREAVSQFGPGRLFALRVTPLAIDLFQLPDGSTP